MVLSTEENPWQRDDAVCLSAYRHDERIGVQTIDILCNWREIRSD